MNEIEAAIQEPELEKENEEICPLGPHGDILCLAWHYSLCLLALDLSFTERANDELPSFSVIFNSQTPGLGTAQINQFRPDVVQPINTRIYSNLNPSAPRSSSSSSSSSSSFSSSSSSSSCIHKFSLYWIWSQIPSKLQV
uniref:Uncharacterized protein n=1 Tax=Populus alba TaxID=43335 RepID=A0A4U5NSR7_POPAL|nr:hypothetical protein D5086_0000240570 [Populus alba]